MWHVVIMAYVAGADHGMWRSCTWAFWKSRAGVSQRTFICSKSASYRPISRWSWQVHLVPINSNEKQTSKPYLITMQPASRRINAAKHVQLHPFATFASASTLPNNLYPHRNGRTHSPACSLATATEHPEQHLG